MGYYIYASLDEGRPRLKVIDSDSQRTRLDWSCHCRPGLDERETAQELHRLFSKLLLLSCQQRLQDEQSENVARSFKTRPPSSTR